MRRNSLQIILLFGSLILSIVFTVSVILALKERERKIEYGRQIRLLIQKDRTYEAFVNSYLAAQTYTGKVLPGLDGLDINGTIVSTDFSERGPGIVLIFKSTACDACLNSELGFLQRVWD